jgi:hypothetical protein
MLTYLVAQILQFTIRTLMRSRRHRMILAFYVGVAFAIAVYFLKTPMAQQQLIDGNPWRDLNAPLMASSLLIVGFAVVGTRVVFSLPLDMQANWVFRITPVRGGRGILLARRRALLIVGLAPAWLLAAAGFLTIRPGPEGAGHVLVLGLAGLIIAEVCLWGVPKLPFTCSYLPGKSNIHITFWFCIGLIVQLIDKVAAFELRMLENRSTSALMLAILTAGWLVLRWRNSTRSEPEEAEVQFEEVPSDALVGLDILKG